MKRVLHMCLRFGLVLSGFLFIFDLPSLLGIGKQTVQLNVNTFWHSSKEDVQHLFTLKDSKLWELFRQMKIVDSYGYTMTLLFGSILVALLMALAVSILVMTAPEKIQNRSKTILNFFEAIPDLLILFLFQFLIIFVYRSTGIRIMALYGIFGARPYFIPIVITSILPFFLLTQFLVKVLSEEENQMYVLYTRAKGMSRLWTILVHMLRNVFLLLMPHLRTVVCVTLSTIYFMEFMYLIPGFTQVFMPILYQRDILSLVFCLILFTLPLLVVEAAGYFVGKKGEEL